MGFFVRIVLTVFEKKLEKFNSGCFGDKGTWHSLECLKKKSFDSF